jgi:hypothetical protein
MAFARKGRDRMEASQHPSTFQNGDEVFLARGSYEGTLGVFLNLRGDPKWADILERNSQVRSHPVEWLEHAKPALIAERADG